MEKESEKYLNKPDHNNQKKIPHNELAQKIIEEKILCFHCLRTASNGIKCKGMCVADSDY